MHIDALAVTESAFCAGAGEGSGFTQVTFTITVFYHTSKLGKVHASAGSASYTATKDFEVPGGGKGPPWQAPLSHDKLLTELSSFQPLRRI
jgi:hypothetical protein